MFNYKYIKAFKIKQCYIEYILFKKNEINTMMSFMQYTH